MLSKELAKFRALENTSDYCVQHSNEFESLPEFNATVPILAGLVVKMHKRKPSLLWGGFYFFGSWLMKELLLAMDKEKK